MSQTPVAGAAAPRAAIRRATSRALCAHGYADLTIRSIGEEFEKSQSLLYHHYDSKDDLLVEFLSFMRERFEAALDDEAVDDPVADLRSLVDRVLEPPAEPDDADFLRAWIELRTQAASNRAFREEIVRSDAAFHDRLASLLREVGAAGRGEAVDADAVAAFVVAAVNGVLFQRVTGDPDAVDRAREALDAYLDERLGAGGVA